MEKKQWSYRYNLLVTIGILWLGVLITACSQASATSGAAELGFVTVTPTPDIVVPKSDVVVPTPNAVASTSGIVASVSGIIASTAGTVTPTVKVAEVQLPSRVRRWLPQVWAGSGDVRELPWLGDENWIDLDSDGLVTTDANGEGWVELKEEGKQCMRIYIFQDSQLTRAPCSKLDTRGNVACTRKGTAAYNNSCASQIIIQTLSAEIQLEGTWVAVTYLEEEKVTIAMVFNAEEKKVDEVTVWPVTDFDARTLGPSPMKVVEEQFWFTVPGDTADPIAGLDARVAHPFEDLLPLVEELDLWPWIDRIKARADDDNVPYPNFPPFAPTATPIPPAPTATVCGPPPGWSIYVVQPNDTLFSLAAQTRTSVAQIQRANCMVSDAVFVGQRLYLPFVPPTPTPTPIPCGPPPYWVLYVVQPRDTLFSLALETGTTVEQIIRANCLVSDIIFEGQRLYLPFVPEPPPPPVEQLVIEDVELFGFTYETKSSFATSLKNLEEYPPKFDRCANPVAGIRATFNRELHSTTVKQGGFQVFKGENKMSGLIDVGSVIADDGVSTKGVATFEVIDRVFPPGTYTVTLRGDLDGPAITDPEGNRLDGEFYDLPSGNGIKGGNFVFEFSIVDDSCEYR